MKFTQVHGKHRIHTRRIHPSQVRSARTPFVLFPLSATHFSGAVVLACVFFNGPALCGPLRGITMAFMDVDFVNVNINPNV